MMATDPFDPNIDRALGARAAARDECRESPNVLTVPTLFGPVDITPAPQRARDFIGACPEEACCR